MKKPDKIYVHTGAHLGMLTLTTIPVGVTDEQEYIRKEALLEWLESKIKIPDVSFISGLTYLAYKDVIDKLNEM